MTMVFLVTINKGGTVYLPVPPVFFVIDTKTLCSRIHKQVYYSTHMFFLFSCLIRVKERFKSKRAKNSTVVLDSHLSGTVRRPYLLQIHASNECWAASPTKAHVLVLLKLSFTLPLVLLFSCSNVLKKHVLLFSCLSKKTCSSVLMSSKKTCSSVLMS